MRIHVRNATRGTSLGDSVDVAETSAQRTEGLLKRNGLKEGEGLWIVPCEGVHTFFMKFTIDVIYIDKSKRVKKVVSRLKPWRMSLCLSAHSVIELPAGTAQASTTQRGDQLELTEPDK